MQTLHQLGYWKRLLGKGRYIYIKETNGVIEEVDKAIIRDDFFKYLEESGDINFSDNGNEVHFPVGAVKELYRRQQSQLFIDPILESLPSHDKPILRDTREICYKVFRNGIVVISKEDVAFMPFSDIKECIWKDSIIPHDIDISHPEDMLTGHFFHYLKNVAGNNIESFISAIGYLLHEYNSSAMGQAVICYDADAGEKVAAFKSIYERTGVRRMTEEKIAAYFAKAGECLSSLSLPAANVRALGEFVESLLHRSL